MNIVLPSLGLLWRSKETPCNLILCHEISYCALCSSSFRATTDFTSGIVDWARRLWFRCAPLSLLLVESFTLFYISEFSKGPLQKGTFSEISMFFSSLFWESSHLVLSHILCKPTATLLFIGASIRLLGYMQGDPCLRYLDFLLLSHLSPLWSIHSADRWNLFFDRYCPHLVYYLSLRGVIRLYLDYFHQPVTHVFFFYLQLGFQVFFGVSLSWLCCCDASLESFSSLINTWPFITIRSSRLRHWQ